ncbi:MAG TPA: glycosyltransferase family 2 protein [Nitrospira sp.]|nr:glycosyltransferase family 2 protein [Nitrospira sp.]
MILIGSFLLLILVPLTLLVLYQWFLALCSLFVRQAPCRNGPPSTRFLVMIPAHNEELGIAGTLASFQRLEYPPERYQILVIADRCTDGTALAARRMGVQCFERFDGTPGKGAALAWGLQEAKRTGMRFDAVVIIDADTLVDRSLLSAFDAELQAGHLVQQGYNYISNPWASPFTRIIAVTGVLRNGRYYAGKTVLGLPGMLTGTGMCLSAEVLNRQGWTAFSVGEDWEFSVELLLSGQPIYFNARAKTFAKESQNLQQASHQRLRWASGRYAVMGSKVRELIREGIRRRSFSLIDSAITLVAPNYSTQASLALVALFAAWPTLGHPTWHYCFVWAAGVFAAIAGYFVLGVLSTESPAKALAGLLLVPVFLPWRLAIEVLGLLGYGRQHWGRMSRAASSHHSNP